ncbi:MAG TPA: hypothetical protein VJ652_14995 [Noviherbaspirillum sp.]|nr:hypothetical protein [Noviherbaspirillum sp.]
MTLDRIAKLEELLRPVTFPVKMSKTTRERVYKERRRLVCTAYPFMDAHEKARADAWLDRWKFRQE